MNRALLLMAISTLGCGVGDSATRETVGRQEESLAMAKVEQPHWPISSFPAGTVPICFPQAVPSREYHHIGVALAQWTNPANNLAFSYLPSCPTSGPRIAIVLADQNTNFRTDGGINTILPDGGIQRNASWGSAGNAQSMYPDASVIVGFCGPNSIDAGVQCFDGGASAEDYEESFRAVVIHEIGHILGLPHEQSRPDFSAAVDCGLLPLDGGLATGESAPYDPSLYAELTVYDLDSIMNYCRGTYPALPDGGPSNQPLPYQQGYKGADLISQLDQLGMEMAHPTTLGRPLVALPSGFASDDGILVARTNGSVTADWVVRGAHPNFLTSAQWKLGSNPIFGATEQHFYYAGSLTAINGSLVDAFGRTLTTVPVNLVVDDSLHTAILSCAFIN